VQTGSLCALDWVCQGRKARGEKWNFWGYGSRNEVWLQAEDGAAGGRRLSLRDNLLLHDENQAAFNDANGSSADGEGREDSQMPSFASRMDNLGVYGTLCLHGPLFAKLGAFFMDEFKLLPRIGGRKWDTDDDKPVIDEHGHEFRRKIRQKQETADGLLWTVSCLRDCTVVKFGAREVEGGKRWLKRMFEEEASVVRHFGERALLCLT